MNSELTSKEVSTLLNFFPNGIVAFDVETTGLSPLSDKIIELAAVKLSPDKKVETYKSFINPEITIPPKTIEIHNITDAMVKDALSIKEELPSFITFIDKMPLIAHNAQFDMGFLIKCCHGEEMSLGEREVFDSCLMGRASFKKLEKTPENYKLSTLAEFFNIPLNHHRALDDSIACLRIFANCLALISAEKRWEFTRGRALIFNTKTINKLENIKLKKECELLVEKIPTQEHVNITYSGGSMAGKPRPIRPIGIIPLPHGLILYAECLLSNTHKSFHLKKIKKVELLEKKDAGTT